MERSTSVPSIPTSTLLDPATGDTRWRFKTTDHIYSSVALGESPDGTHTIYLASTDGILYALDAATGEVRWTYDAGDPIRSSPVVGAGPTGEGGAIVYFGAGNGKLYALDAATGAAPLVFRYDAR